MPKYKMYIEMTFETSEEYDDVHAEGTLDQTESALSQLPMSPPPDVDPLKVFSIAGITRL